MPERLLLTMLLLSLLTSGTAAQTAPQQGPIQLYRKGVDARIEGDYYGALEFFKAALEKNPGYFDPTLASADVYFVLEEYDQALALTEKAISLSKANSSARILKARILACVGDPKGAAEIYRAVLSSEPNNLEARLGKAELEISQGKNKNASREYLETLKIAPNNRRALLSLAVLFQSQGDVVSAQEYFELAVRYHGDVPLTHLLAGEFFLRRGMLDKADEHAGIALTLRPDYEDAMMLRGAVQLKRGRYQDVYDVMDRVIALNRNNASAWYMKGLSSLRIGKPQDGIQFLRTLVSLKPDDEIARITLEDSLREFLPVEDPVRASYADHHFDRGDAFQERNLFSRAFEEYRRGLQVNPYSKRGRIAFADILSRLGFEARALQALVFLKDQKIADRDVLERIETGQSLLEDRVSRMWKIDQFAVRKEKFSLAVFHDPGKSLLVHEEAGTYLSRFFSDLLVGSPKFSLAADPVAVTGFSQAFQEARQRKSDYFFMLSFSETEREFVAKADLYLSRTGAKIDSFQVFRTGNDKVQNALVQLTASAAGKFPFRGELLKRQFERGIVSLGIVDGIKKGDKLEIVSSKKISLKFDSIEFVYKPEDVLGTVVVTSVDDLVSEGTVEKTGFFDRLNPGDTVIAAKPEGKKSVPEREAPDVPLYKRILRIR